MPIAATVSPAARSRAATSPSVSIGHAPDVVGVVLDPAGLREVLRELAVRRVHAALPRSSTANARTPVVPASIAITTGHQLSPSASAWTQRVGCDLGARRGRAATTRSATVRCAGSPSRLQPAARAAGAVSAATTIALRIARRTPCATGGRVKNPHDAATGASAVGEHREVEVTRRRAAVVADRHARSTRAAPGARADRHRRVRGVIRSRNRTRGPAAPEIQPSAAVPPNMFRSARRQRGRIGQP